MPRKALELPPDVARAFVRDMRAYFAEKDAIKKDEIAARQLWLLAAITDVWEMFVQIRGEA